MASDTPDQNLTQYFSVCNDFIHAARLRDGNVLIHCLAGMSRSVTVAVAYIMSVSNLNWKEALKVVRAGRAVANPNLGFQKQLEDFECTKILEGRPSGPFETYQFIHVAKLFGIFYSHNSIFVRTFNIAPKIPNQHYTEKPITPNYKHTNPEYFLRNELYSLEIS
ncbi:unnamed protein product [Phaedon cochleariae]|uniref:Dual specificity protein phosphatase n=1 Tax=Phaedon cochleariae TaxID=80249 RepID=A0A9N9X2Q6_PHACE|nr:unnamed protein product [Phaedon cochleariae]